MAKCSSCGGELHRSQGIDYMGDHARHSSREACLFVVQKRGDDRIAALEAEVSRLTQERDVWKKETKHWQDLWQKAAEVLDKNSSHIAELRADRERLDWLERSNISATAVNDIVNGFRWGGKYCGNMRRAIDAAKKAGA